jgi:hypothetical protein
VVGLTGRTLGVAVAVALVLGGCGDGGEQGEASAEVAACDDLRQRENALIAVANEALADLGAATDDVTRAQAIASGYERLAALAAEQAQTAGADAEPELREPLSEAAARAATELAAQRDRISDRGLVVTQSDERGRAGELQNALEKAFSNLEPPRSVYRSAGLAEATDQDPDCRFVTQRADPAG